MEVGASWASDVSKLCHASWPLVLFRNMDSPRSTLRFRGVSLTSWPSCPVSVECAQQLGMAVVSLSIWVASGSVQVHTRGSGSCGHAGEEQQGTPSAWETRTGCQASVWPGLLLGPGDGPGHGSEGNHSDFELKENPPQPFFTTVPEAHLVPSDHRPGGFCNSPPRPWGAAQGATPGPLHGYTGQALWCTTWAPV